MVPGSACVHLEQNRKLNAISPFAASPTRITSYNVCYTKLLRSMISAMVSMSGIQQRLDLLADNMANLNTVGFKRKEATFEDTLTRVQQQAKGMELPGRVSPRGFNLGFGSMMAGAEVNFEQGSIKQTDIPTDLAIEGNALFSVMTAGNIKAYTRRNNFV